MRKKNGFGMIETIVAVGIVGGAALMLSQIFGQANKEQKRLSGSLDFNTKMWEVLSTLNRSDACTLTTNQVFKFKSGNTFSPAKYGANSNEVNWVGFEANGQSVKVLEEGDEIGSRVVNSISFADKTDDSGNPIPALNNTPVSGQSTRDIILTIQATLPGGSLAIQKTLSFQIVTDNTNSNIVGCSSIPGQSAPQIGTPAGKFPTNFLCNNISADGNKWSIGFWFHSAEFRANGTIRSIRYRDLYNRYIDFNSDGTYQNGGGGIGACSGKSISQLTQTVTPPL